jgi:L-threonylcarbamoyladenylate synthase
VLISQRSESFRQVSDVVARGGVIAFRTDTFYGLGADPFNRSAVRRIKELKGREDCKAILIVISDRRQFGRFIHQPSAGFKLLAKRFWPGPLTIIGKAADEVPSEITAGTSTVGVRLPADGKVRALIEACGGCLTATSANLSDQPPAKTALEVQAYFGALVDLIVDGGETQVDQPSTVIDASGLEVRLIRAGAIAWSAIEDELRSIETT